MASVGRNQLLLTALVACLALLSLAQYATAVTTSNTTASGNSTTASTTTVNAIISIAQCRWNMNRRTCDLSGGYLLAAFAGDKTQNSYAKGLLRSEAVELACNQRATNTTCGADARCAFDATKSPACRSNPIRASASIQATYLCPGSIAAAYIPCTWATSAAACAAAGNCTWSAANTTCRHRAFAAMDAGELEEYAVELAALQTSIYGECPGFTAFAAYAAACTDMSAETTQDFCNTFNFCVWAGSQCSPTALALVTQVFNARDGDATTDAASACAGVRTSAGCAAAGEEIALNSTLVAAVASWNVSVAAGGASMIIDDTYNVPIITTGGVRIVRGAAATSRPGRAAALGGALFFFAAALL